MKKTIILLTFCILGFSGCASESDTVSREEYESVVAEVEELKSQIESIGNDENNVNAEIPDSSTNVEISEPILSDEETQKEREWLRDFSFEYDENNRIFISLYKEGERNLYLNGYGVYEEENLGLLQYDRKFLCAFLELLAGEGDTIDMIFTVGEEEYSLIFDEGELITDTVPMDGVDEFLEKYNSKRNALDLFMDFIHNE